VSGHDAALDAYLGHLGRLIRRGRELRGALAGDPTGLETLPPVRIWQHDCASLVSQLSGGVKSHWLSRAYSEALLVRSTRGEAVTEANLADIVDRVLEVLGRAVHAVSSVQDSERSTRVDGPSDAPLAGESAAPVRRFDFVHDSRLRPVISQAYADSRTKFDEGDLRQALVLSCSVLEAVITDALAHRQGPEGEPWETSSLAEWSFERRIAAAERAGLILGGCARLPPVARTYRDLTDAEGRLRPEVAVSPRDAQLVRQVLAVVLRDLDPGR
jgi:hypothetical protein